VPALIFAWAFELTPEGVKRESEVKRDASYTAQTASKLNLVTIGLVIAAVAFVALDRYLHSASQTGGETPAQAAQSSSDTAAPAPVAATAARDQSVAVLPFANRSNQDDDLFFTDGIHDDLLTQLAKIHDLRVISRTSVMEYRDTTKNLRQIGTELGVATILEGGIQRVGNRVRINAQLIEAATDRHLWAETFDRELTAENIFELQSEIARKIVDAISIELTPEESQRLAQVPTRNLAAYEAHLRAREVFYSANYSRSQELAARPWLEKALELDPNYVEAQAMLAELYGQQVWRGLDTSESLLAQYRALLDRAKALSPDSPATLRALANYHYRVENDYAASLQLLDRALEQWPGNVDVHGDRGLALRRLGRWDESVASFQRALQLDPANRFYRAIMLETLDNMFDWQGILDNSVPLDQADPRDLDTQLHRAGAQFQQTGDLAPVDRVLATMNLVATDQYQKWSARVHWLRRDTDAVIAVLNNDLWMGTITEPAPRVYRLYELANAYRLAGDEQQARKYFEALVGDRKALDSGAMQGRGFAGITAAVALARLGRHDEAKAKAESLLREIPQERDAVVWAWLLTGQAMVLGLAGDTDAAIDQLEIALRTPGYRRITAWDLRLDPNWDFLREHPRFAALTK